MPPKLKSALETLLVAAQGEAVKNAVDADQRPAEFRVIVDGREMGTYKGKNADNLQRIIKFRMEEAKLTHEVAVAPVAVPTAATADEPAPAEEPATT